MPRRQFNKDKSGKQLANATGAKSTLVSRSALFKVASDGTIQKSNTLGIFLLNPNSYEESKAANWVMNNIPGQSDPILQWVSSGPRKVTFDALVTKDTSDYDSMVINFQEPQTGTNKFLSVVGQVASAFFQITVPPPRTTRTALGVQESLDISDHLNYYRSMLYPIYDNIDNPRRLRQSPPLVVLYAGSAVTKLPYENKVGSLHDLWVVTNLRIKITKQLPNLAPMEAIVSFELTQYNIKSFHAGRFTDKRIK